MIIAGGIMSD